MGRFALHKGESTDNGKIGVKIVDVFMPPCQSPFAEPPKPIVSIQLYDAADRHVICEDGFSTTGTTLLDFACSKGSRYFVDVEGINTRDKWVAFSLGRIDQ